MPVAMEGSYLAGTSVEMNHTRRNTDCVPDGSQLLQEQSRRSSTCSNHKFMKGYSQDSRLLIYFRALRDRPHRCVFAGDLSRRPQ